MKIASDKMLLTSFIALGSMAAMQGIAAPRD